MPDKFILTHNASAGLAGYNRAYKITHEDLTETAANTAQTLTLENVKLGTVVKGAAFYLKTPFEDASDNALNTTTIIVGDGGSTSRFIVSKELNVNGTEILSWATANATDTLPYAYVTTDTIDVIVGSMADKSLSDIDTGELWVFLEVAELADVSVD